MTYKVTCKKCDKKKYIGKTSRNAFTRGREHWKGIPKKNKDIDFHVNLHGVEEHGGNVQVRDMEMEVTGIYGGDATKREIAEAETIQHAQ